MMDGALLAPSARVYYPIQIDDIQGLVEYTKLPR